MQLALALTSVLLAGVLVMLVPGACLLALWRLDRIVPPPLVPAAAFALSLVPITAVMVATLLLELSIHYVAGTLAALVLVAWAKLARRARLDRHDDRFTRARVRTTPRDWLVPVRDFACGAWLRAIPRGALVFAAIASLLALVVGFHAWNDSLYHIAQARKLLVLDAPNFSNTLQFTDGGAHPGYLLPAWHECMALVSFISQQDPVTAAWMLPGLAFPMVLLSFGGLAWTLTRVPGATTLAASAVLVLAIAGLPYTDVITNLMQPGVLALGTLAPLVLAMVFTAAWSDRTSDARGATFVAVVATAALGMFHVSYLWVLGMGVLGYFLLWALRSPWARTVVRRHLLTGTCIALVAATMVALLYPGLTRLETTGRDAATELRANESQLYEGQNGAELDRLLVGDPEDAYHLRADYLIQSGGLALLGLLGMALVAAAPRWPGGWYLTGAGFLVTSIALSDQLFPAFVDLVTLDQARRIERVLPHALGLAALLATAGVATAQLWRRGGRGRIAATGVAAGSAAAVAAVAHAVPRLGGYAGDPIIGERVLLALLALLALGVGAQLAGLLLRVLRLRRGRTATGLPGAATWTWPGAVLDARAISIATALLLVGSAPVYAQLRTVVDADRLRDTPLDMRGAELRLFSSRVAAQLRELPTGAVVLADPRTRNPYTTLAIAPVYVVASVPRHTALTPENRVTERFETAVEFFVDGTSPARRLEILRAEDVDAVLVHPAASRAMRDQVEALDGVRVVATGKNQRLYLIDREQLD